MSKLREFWVGTHKVTKALVVYKSPMKLRTDYDQFDWIQVQEVVDKTLKLEEPETIRAMELN